MVCEIPITERVYQKLRQHLLFEPKYATPPVFMVDISEYRNAVFILIHGDTNGNVAISKNVHVNLETLLKSILHAKENDFMKKGINKIYTISCHGGLQIPFEHNGFTIMSVHNSKSKIHTSANGFIDGSYVL